MEMESPDLQQIQAQLADLMAGGVPDSLEQRPMLVDASQEEREELGGAFEGGEGEPSFLDDVSTAVPSVEVR